MSRPQPKTGSFDYHGLRIAYRDHGEGPRAIVLTHGLLMDGRMFDALGPSMARRGHRVITIDVLGHGASDQPYDMTAYSMTEFGRQVVALLDHLRLDQAVIGGTSLGANVTLEVAVAAPERVRALLIEMPVLERALPAAAAVFVPLALSLRLSQPGMRLLASLARRIPRTVMAVDILLDFVRRDPRASLSVLDGITFGRIAPGVAERREIDHATLVIGHRRDPIHPFSDAEMLARELRGGRMLEAKSIVEWRLFPRRLDAALADWLDEVWREPAAAAGGSTRNVTSR